MNDKNSRKINLADSSLGTKVIFATDQFFADANRMLQPSEPIFIDDKYDENGHWMDGWETRRRRDNGHDYCIVKLGLLSKIETFEISTIHFKGNFPSSISIQGYYAPDMSDEDMVKKHKNLEWLDFVIQSDLSGNKKQDFDCLDQREVTHLMINIFPDGGIARLRAYGDVSFNEKLYKEKNYNVISAISGARAIYANDEHFSLLRNILLEEEATNMGDGWETRRRREPGYDWGIIELANPAIVRSIMVDTNFFKGNFPESFSINSAYIEKTTDSAVVTQSIFWEELIPAQKLQMSQKHYFDNSYLLHNKPITHIRINIFPDGGISRLKLLGEFVKV